MEKNYYEILEVDKNASNEIIEKAYKTLAKKYHPDLQSGEIKKKYEEKMKRINEAYSILSDENQKSIYDEQLQNMEITQEEYKNLVEENILLKQEVAKLSQNIQQGNQKVNIEQQYSEHINNAVRQAYQDAYVQDLRNRGYKIRYKKTFKEKLKNVAAIIIIIFIIVLICQLPFVKSFLVKIYENNLIIKAIVDSLKDTIEL